MGFYSLIVCDSCGATQRLPHAASPKNHAHIFHAWTTDGADLCPTCSKVRP